MPFAHTNNCTLLSWVSVVEVTETVESLKTPCLCSLDIPWFNHVVKAPRYPHTQQELFWPLCLIQRPFGKFPRRSCHRDVIDVGKFSTLIGCCGTESHNVAGKVQYFKLRPMMRWRQWRRWTPHHVFHNITQDMTLLVIASLHWLCM